MKLKKVNIDELELWEKNPRTISKQDFERLKYQLKKLGVYKPLLAYYDSNLGKYVVLGGNMRLRALRELGLKEVEVSIVEPKSEAEKIEYSLSDNDRAGAYDEQLLAELIYPELDNIEIGQFHVDIGRSFSLESIIEEFAPSLNENGSENEEEPEKMEMILSAGFSDAQLIELLGKDLARTPVKRTMIESTTLSEQAYAFNRLCAGYRDGNSISLIFNPHRLDVKCANFKIVPDELTERDAMILARDYIGFQKKITDIPKTLDWLFRIGMNGYYMAKEFFPYNARNLILRYYPTAESVRVLDPCHGWGDRLIGSLASLKRVFYLGVDPSRETHEGAKRLADFLLSAEKVKALGSSVELICEAYEEAQLPDEPFDIAITSPPYFDTEQYDPGSEKQAHNRYQSFDEFVDGFMRTLIEKTINHLKPGAPLILNVGNTKYDMLRAVRSLCDELGLLYRTIDPPMSIGGTGGPVGNRTSVEEEGIIGEPFIEIKTNNE